MTEQILYAFGEWSVRAVLLSGLAALLLWLCRIRDVHARLTTWTVILAGLMLMPVVIFTADPIFVWVVSDAKPTVAAPAYQAAPAPVRDVQYTPAVPVANRFSGNDLAIAFWFVIALALLSRVVIGLWLAARLSKRSIALGDDLRESTAVHIPVTVGLFRPAILLPVDWRVWDAAKLRAVLAHERAHVERWDPLRQAAASVFCSFAWFHPIAWWLRAHLMELAVSALANRACPVYRSLQYFQR